MGEVQPAVALGIGDVPQEPHRFLQTLVVDGALEPRSERSMSDDHPLDVGDARADERQRAQHHVVALVALTDARDGEQRRPRSALVRSGRSRNVHAGGDEV